MFWHIPILKLVDSINQEFTQSYAKKSSGFFIFAENTLAKFWLSAGVIALAALTMGAATQSDTYAALTPEPTPVTNPAVDVTKLVRKDPIASASKAFVEAAEKPVAKAEAKPVKPKVKKIKKGPHTLTGKVGYAVAGGNCVAEPGINNPGIGNPSEWPVTTQTPKIGLTAVFTWNHVGVVTGIWSNGDIEVRHQNYWGGQHRFPRSTFRGFR